MYTQSHAIDYPSPSRNRRAASRSARPEEVMVLYLRDPQRAVRILDPIADGRDVPAADASPSAIRRAAPVGAGEIGDPRSPAGSPRCVGPPITGRAGSGARSVDRWGRGQRRGRRAGNGRRRDGFRLGRGGGPEGAGRRRGGGRWGAGGRAGGASSFAWTWAATGRGPGMDRGLGAMIFACTAATASDVRRRQAARGGRGQPRLGRARERGLHVGRGGPGGRHARNLSSSRWKWCGPCSRAGE